MKFPRFFISPPLLLAYFFNPRLPLKSFSISCEIDCSFRVFYNGKLLIMDRLGKALVLSLLVICLFSGAVSGSPIIASDLVLFVGLSGNDETGKGSRGFPFRTLEKAAREAVPGTTIYVRGGHYLAANELIFASGTADNPITIQPFEDERVVFDGIGSSVGLFGHIILISGSKHIIFQGFEVRNSAGRGISVYESEHIQIKDNVVYHTQRRAIGGSGHGLTFEGNEIYQAVLENEHEALNLQGGWSSALRTAKRADGSASTDILIKDNFVHDVWGEGINALFADNVVIEGNEVRDAYGVNIYIDHAYDVTVDNNLLYSTNPLFYRSDHFNSPAHGISMANELYTDPPNTQIEQITIKNNTIMNTGTGIRYWQDIGNKHVENSYRNIVIINNIISETMDEAISFAYIDTDAYAEPNATLSFNTLHEGANGVTLNLGNPTAWEIRNNSWPDRVLDKHIYIPIAITQ